MSFLISALIASVVSVGVAFFYPPVIVQAPPQPAPVVVNTQASETEPTFGAAVQFVGGSSYALAGSGVSSSATSFTLTSLTLPQNGYKLQDSDFSTTFYVTLEPGNRSRQEFVSCTTVTQNAAGTATLSGCTRGLSPVTPYTASTTLQFAHAGGTQLIFSDPPQLFDQAAFKANDETITGQWTFSTFPITPSNSTSSETVAGVVEMATGAEMAASTQNGAVGRLAIPASLATSTYNSATAGSRVPVTGSDGTLDHKFLTQAAPVGSLTAYASTTAPTGWLLANGQAVSRTTYSALYLVLGTSYGVGDGSTTFNLPDITGKGIVMASSTQSALQGLNRATLGAIGTTTSHTQTLAELAPHTHTITADNTDDSNNNGTAADQGDGTPNSISSNSAGGGSAFNTLDPYIILNYIIKY